MKYKEIDERFDKEFYKGTFGFGDNVEWSSVQDFLHTELSTLRSDLLKEILKKMPKKVKLQHPNDPHLFDDMERSGFNDCLDQVTSLINNLIEEK